MFAAYITRGVKAGLIAGLVFGLFIAVVANPLVAYADEANHAAADSGDGHGPGHGHERGHGAGGGHGGGERHHDTAVSMAMDRTVSVVSGGLWALMLGGVVFGVGYYFLEPAIPGRGATRSYVLALAGFGTVSGAPWLVLPPVAPGARQSLSVTTRLLLYGGMMAAGALACLLGGVVYDRLVGSRGRAVAAVGALLPFGLLAIPAVLAPTNSVDGVLAPELRAGLTGLFVFGQVLLWLVLAAAHARFAPTDGSRARPDPSLTAD